jgi:hypothetical protein
MARTSEKPEYTLFLAVPSDVFGAFFTLPLPQLAIQQYAIKLFTFDPDMEIIQKWIN